MMRSKNINCASGMENELDWGKSYWSRMQNRLLLLSVVKLYFNVMSLFTISRVLRLREGRLECSCQHRRIGKPACILVDGMSFKIRQNSMVHVR
jgi:hypothetical protein